MSLPDSYTQKTNAIPTYFEAILDAHPPERFNSKFLETLDFTSTNDRLMIGVLKDLGFIDADGVPTERYYRYLDRDQAPTVLAEGIREAFADLFAVNKNAQDLGVNEVQNKLRTLYAGAKTDLVISRIAKTFKALCAIADFSKTAGRTRKKAEEPPPAEKSASHKPPEGTPQVDGAPGALSVRALEYHINIVLPESRDQAVFDAIFKSLREHLR